MSTFDKREEQFEKKFAHDAALQFKAHARRAKLLGLWAAEKLGLSGEAAEAYEKAAGLAPRDPGPPNGLGVLSVEAGDFDRAAAFFEQALVIDPDYHEARLNLAVAEMRRGHADAARAALDDLLRRHLDPDTARKAAAFRREIVGR